MNSSINSDNFTSNSENFSSSTQNFNADSEFFNANSEFLTPNQSEQFPSANSVPNLPDLCDDGVQPTFPPTIMAVCTDSSRCGCAIYSDSTVQLVADRKDTGDPYKGLDLIIQRVGPKIVVVSSVQKKLIDFLEKRFRLNVVDLSFGKGFKSSTAQKSTEPLASQAPTQQLRSQNWPHQSFGNSQLSQHPQDSSGDPTQTTQTETDNGTSPKSVCDFVDPDFTLALVPNMWFSLARATQKLIDSEFVTSRGITDIEEKLMFVTSRIKKSVDACAVRAISALNSYIIHEFTKSPDSGARVAPRRPYTQGSATTSLADLRSQSSNQASVNSQEHLSENLMPILDVKYVDPGPVLSIDRLTLEALHILDTSASKSRRELDSDPDIESIPSLYSLLNECASVQGKRQLRTIMMWPLQDIDELTHRHRAVDFFVKPENKLLRDQFSVQLKNVVPLSSTLIRLNQSIGTYKELSIVYKALWAFTAMIDLIKANDQHGVEIFNRIAALDAPELRAAVDSIMNIVDFEASRREKRIQVCSGVDKNVDEKKEMVANLARLCDEVGIQETSKYRAILGKPCRVLYIPRIGFLTGVEYSSISDLMQIRSNNEFDILLHTESSVYFKTKRMEDLDKNAGDVACDLIDVQESVLVDLQTELLKHTETILRLMELCGELDCLIAFSIVSFQRGYTRPEFVSADEEMDIQQAYHPLHSTKYNTIPNDITFHNEISQRKVKIMVITGPNSCGKSTYMRATCLVIYMAHIGCFVPALLARMPTVDAILTRLHTSNSISTGLSSFATDLHQINYALARATERSFIAIDEFGEGTLASDGFHLLKGLVTYFAVRMNRSPHVMIATHFNRLINHMQTYSEYILYRTFKVTRDLSKGSVVYEFKIMDGVGEVSLADDVAARAGVPQKIIDRAKQIRALITEGRTIGPHPASGA